MSTTSSSEVLIVGAGLAGLSAAIALSGAGANVTLLERKPYVGGRAYSYLHPALNEVIDSQHVLLGCCTNLIDLCRLTGADRHIRWYDRITFLEPAGNGKPAQRSEIGPSWLPAPAHSSFSFLTAPMLSVSDKAAVARGLAEFLRGYPASDEEPFSVWLEKTGQTRGAVRHFWEPVIVGALNDTFERCSTRYAGQVFHESFLKSPQGGRLGIPTQPLSDFYAPVAQLAERQGTKLHLRCSIETLQKQNNGWLAVAADGCKFFAEKLLLALPFEQTAKLLEGTDHSSDASVRLQQGLPKFSHAPIATVHLWFDRDVTDLDHAALLDTRIQWMFNKTRIRRKATQSGDKSQYLELVISASFPEVKMSRDAILRPALDELARFFPKARTATLIKSGILKEARATFSVTPGLDRFRPSQEELGDNLYLAGDWTRSGWPSTMEGAVRSGRLAAQAMSRSGAYLPKIISDDLHPSGLMRLLTTRRP